jgi:hypothetical protein
MCVRPRVGGGCWETVLSCDVHTNTNVLLQVEPYRACQQSSKGLDSTLMGNVAVILLNDVQPYISGCVAYDNQVQLGRGGGGSTQRVPVF